MANYDAAAAFRSPIEHGTLIDERLHCAISKHPFSPSRRFSFLDTESVLHLDPSLDTALLTSWLSGFRRLPFSEKSSRDFDIDNASHPATK